MNDVEGQTSIFYWHNGDSKLYFYQSGAISQRSLLLNYVYDMRREVVLIGDDSFTKFYSVYENDKNIRNFNKSCKQKSKHPPALSKSI